MLRIVQSEPLAQESKKPLQPTCMLGVSGILQELGPRNKINKKANGTNQFSKLERAEKKSCKQRSDVSCFNNIDYYKPQLSQPLTAQCHIRGGHYCCC